MTGARLERAQMAKAFFFSVLFTALAVTEVAAQEAGNSPSLLRINAMLPDRKLIA